MIVFLLSIWKKCKELILFIFSMTGNEEQVGGFDLIYKNGPIKVPSNSIC